MIYNKLEIISDDILQVCGECLFVIIWNDTIIVVKNCVQLKLNLTVLTLKFKISMLATNYR
jgi:hypothetical protein